MVLCFSQGREKGDGRIKTLKSKSSKRSAAFFLERSTHFCSTPNQKPKRELFTQQPALQRCYNSRKRQRLVENGCGLLSPQADQLKERISKILDITKEVVHYGYLPLILYLGTKPLDKVWICANWELGYTRSEPKPALIR
jgi:import receptor subunit TOM7